MSILGDIAAGVRGLPHMLGLRRDLALVWGIPIALGLLIWLLHLSRIVPGQPLWLAAATLVAAISTVVTMLLYRRNPAAATLKLNFYIQAFSAMAFAACWLIAVIA
jgi:hypothetical protein